MEIHKIFFPEKKNPVQQCGGGQKMWSTVIISSGHPDLVLFLCHGLVLCLVPVQPLRRHT